MRRLAFLLLAALPISAGGEDARLTQLRAMLVPLRANPRVPLASRGATPQFTTIKHRLRDWIESQLTDFSPITTYAIQERLNRDLHAAGLLCKFGDGPDYVPDCPEFTERGYLSPIKIRAEGDILSVQTGVGVQNCGFDDSAYAYQWKEKWTRFWQSEQNDYTESKYLPQRIEDVVISSPYRGNRGDLDEHLILTLGVNPWCTSNWQPVYYRVWRTKSGYAEPKLLLDGSEIAWIGHVPPISGSVGTVSGPGIAYDEVWIDYSVQDFSDGMRLEVRHYHLVADKLERVDPVALGPHDFVDQWVRQRWDDTAGWTDAQIRQRIEQWKIAPNPANSWPDLFRPSFHCEPAPDRWQVELRLATASKNSGSLYFLVHWQPPFHFTMIDYSDRPWPGCTQPDPDADRR